MTMQIGDGVKKLSEMSDEDLLAMLGGVRKNRLTPTERTVAKATKEKKKGTVTKATAKSTISALSPEQRAQLLKDLGG